MDQPVCRCSICATPMTQYHPPCLTKWVDDSKEEIKDLVKKLNDLKRENAGYRERLEAGKVRRENEEREKAVKKKTLGSKIETYDGLMALINDTIQKEKAELDGIEKRGAVAQSFQIIETKRPQSSGTQDKMANKESEKVLAERRLKVLIKIKGAFMVLKNQDKDMLLKTKDSEKDKEKVSLEMCFLIHHMMDTIARCYFLELPAKYTIPKAEKEAGTTIFYFDPFCEATKTNLNFLYGYFGVDKPSEDTSYGDATKSLLYELIERENSIIKSK